MAWKEKLYGAMAVAAAFMLLQAKLTWVTSPITLDELIKFGGVAGELYIGTLLMIAFYIRMSDRVALGLPAIFRSSDCRRHIFS
jgi:hypothetical protein